METTSFSNVSSVALTQLQTELRVLSNSLRDLYEVMNADMRGINEFWQDRQYQDFVEGFTPQVNKCNELSERYNAWCKGPLQLAIDNSAAIEQHDVSGMGGSVSNSAGSGSAVDTDGAVDTNAASSKFSRFNMNVTANEGANPDIVMASERQVSDAAADMCARNSAAKGVISVEHNVEGGSWGVNGQGKVAPKGLFKGFVDAELEGGGEYNSGKTTSKVRVEQVVDCSKL